MNTLLYIIVAVLIVVIICIVILFTRTRHTLSSESFTSSQQLLNVKNYGAIGDGKTDDTKAIQSAIDYYKQNTKGNSLYFPAGEYLVTYLDLSQFTSFNITGDGSGSTGITGDTFGTKINSINAGGATAFDFSGSSFGVVSDIAFIADNTPASCVLLARIDNVPNGYGSDIAFYNCNFNGGSRVTVLSHSAEVISFFNCRIHFSSTYGFIFTDRGSYYAENTKYTLTSSTSLTLIRFYGGSFAGDNSIAMLLDACSTSGADISLNNVYIEIAGDSGGGITVTGPWQNIGIYSTRVEMPEFKGDPSTQFVSGVNMSDQGSTHCTNPTSISASYIQIDGNQGDIPLIRGAGVINNSILLSKSCTWIKDGITLNNCLNMSRGDC